MKRRDFIALLGSATAASAAWPLAVGAQTPPKIPRVGYIAGANPAAAEHPFGEFQKRLRGWGYVEGQSIALEARWAEGRMERIPELWWLSLLASHVPQPSEPLLECPKGVLSRRG